MDPGVKTHLFMFFLDPACLQCRRQSATQSQDLSTFLTEGKVIRSNQEGPCEVEKSPDMPVVAQVDCSANKMICEIFGGNQLQQPIYIKDKTVYRLPQDLTVSDMQSIA